MIFRAALNCSVLLLSANEEYLSISMTLIDLIRNETNNKSTTCCVYKG